MKKLPKMYLGIDVHKKTYSITAIYGDQSLSKSMPADPDGLISYLAGHFAHHRIYSAYEASFCGFSLHRSLKKAGIQNIVINPGSIEVASRDFVKTDRIDSRKLAEHLALGRLKAIHIPTVKDEQMAEMTRTREQLVQQKVALDNKIKMKLLKHGLIIDGQNRQVTKSFLQKILEDKQLSKRLKLCFQPLISVWFAIKDEIANLEMDLKKQAEEDSYLEQIYRSVPGVGPLSARILANELKDMRRFKNQKQLFSYLGLTPREHSSGERVYRGHISRQGSARLRKILTEVSWRAIKQDPKLREFYQHIAQSRGGKRAIIAVARKLAGRIRAAFRSNQYILNY